MLLDFNHMPEESSPILKMATVLWKGKCSSTVRTVFCMAA